MASAVVLVVAARMGWLTGTRGGGGRGRRSTARGGVVRGGVREVGGVDAPVWLVAALLIYLSVRVGWLLTAAVLGVPAGAATLASGADGFERAAQVQLGAYVFAIGTGALVLMMLRPRAGGGAGLELRWGDVPRGLAAMALLAPVYLMTATVSMLVSSLWTGAPSDPIKHETLAQLKEHGSSPWAWGMIAAAAVGAPVVEELTFRAGLQSFWLRVTGAAWGGWAAVGATAVCFAAVHIGGVPPSALPALLVLGLGFGLAYERTGRLGVPIVMHVVFNAVNVGVVMMGWVGGAEG